MHLTLLVPELIWPEPADQFTLGKLSLPGLETLLARARFEHRPRRAFEQALASSLNLDPAPFGPLRLLGEGCAEARDGHWLCADPVHLRFHHERIVLADAGAFELSENEARQIAASLNEEFGDIGHFHVAEARRWYLRLHTPLAHHVDPLSCVAGRRVDDELPKGDSTLNRWLNEVQMFLHGHPINEQRQAAGQPIINSLWLWGGGTLPAPTNGCFSEIWSTNPLAAGVALASERPVHAVPANLDALTRQAGATPLVVLDTLLPRVLYEDGEGWRTQLTQLDADWFAPLGKALGRQIRSIELIAPTIFGELHYTLQASDRWKFWKRARPLPELAQQLAELAQP
ncbi:MAG: hypothetical protein D3M94_12460 [Rhodocyclales bacterium GT-UBC]|nr:MAG: hypothetical protein D3M94_12460 [Rhodocyclales bacterium GT-UBC]